MRNTTCLCLVLTMFSFFGCSKSGTPAPPSNTNPVTGTMKINLTYPNDQGTQTFELIISQSNGVILLDTIAALSTPVIATLHTNDNLVDVTTVRFIQGMNNYAVSVFKGVNASTLTTTGLGSYKLKTQVGTTTPANILYTNVPSGIYSNAASLNNTLFTNFPGNEFSGLNLDAANVLQVYYNQSPGNYAYLLLPTVGLYNLHMPTSTADTVDLTSMDTALSLTFNRPYPFTVIPAGSSFIGIPDTTNLNQIIGFSSIFQPYSRTGVDFEYPKVAVEKYELYVSATDSTGDYGYYYYGSNIPTTLPFARSSDFSIASSQSSGFSVSFPGTTPTYYLTQWNGANVILSVYSSPDSGSLKPIDWLTALKSSLLNSVGYTDLTLRIIEIDDVPGMNYASWLAYTTNPAAIATRQVTSASSFSQTFP
jgi:hypothetical protein